MTIRAYRPSDLPEITELFYDTVHTVNVGDYTAEQLDAWADGSPDLAEWGRTLLEHVALVAVEGETLVGFGDMDRSGYLDRLYVHKDFQRRGIASALTGALAAETMARGKIPFYCCAWSNIRSARNAIRSGFRPAWVEMTVKPRAFVEEMNR